MNAALAENQEPTTSEIARLWREPPEAEWTWKPCLLPALPPPPSATMPGRPPAAAAEDDGCGVPAVAERTDGCGVKSNPKPRPRPEEDSGSRLLLVWLLPTAASRGGPPEEAAGVRTWCG